MRATFASTAFGPSLSARPASSRGGDGNSLQRASRFAALLSDTGGARGAGPSAPGRSTAPVPSTSPPAPAVSEVDASFAVSASASASLRSTLAALGIETGSATFTPRADLISTPFGSYWNRQIEVRTPDGRWEMYSADLVQKSPEVAACEVKSLLTRST